MPGVAFGTESSALPFYETLVVSTILMIVKVIHRCRLT